MASIKGFLTGYFKQLHFNSMDPSVEARWNEYLKLDDLTNSMKDWRDQLMYEYPADSKKYVRFGLPNIEQGLNDDRVNAGKSDPGLTPEQITELYKYINDAVSGMASDKRLNYNEFSAAKKFVEDFYGDTKIFHIIKVSGPVKAELENLVTSGLLNQLKQPIEDAIRYIGGEKKPSFRDIVDGITSGKYDKDSTFRSQLSYIFERIESAASWTWAQNPTNSAALNRFISIRDNLIQGLDPQPNTADVDRFKRSIQGNNEDQKNKNVLIRLYKSAKVKEVFSSHDTGGIIGTLDTARSEVDYDKKDSDNYLYPKTEKHLNFPQQIKDKWDKFSENRLQKWHNLGGDYMFSVPEAYDIVKAIKKEKIKPTDGLAAILDNAKKIQNNMAHSKVSTGKHFDWFIKELEIIKDADGKAFEKCLSNGVSMRGVVSRIIKDGANGKKAEAKTALNILSAIKYENTTSKVLDAIKDDKELFTILSNEGLSINKNPAVHTITKAMDKTIRIGGIAIATTATFIMNTIRKMGSKIKKENKDLAAAHNAWLARNTQNKAELTNAIANTMTLQATAQNTLNGMPTESILNTNLATQQTRVDRVLNATNQEIEKLKQFVESGAATPDEISAAKTFMDSYDNYIQGNATGLVVDNSWPYSIKFYTQRIRSQLNNFDNLRSNLNTAQSKKQAFMDATAQLEAATNELAEQQKEMNDWDKNHHDDYAELVKFWNKLETGRDMHLGRMLGGHYSHFGSKTKQQEAYFDKLKAR